MPSPPDSAPVASGATPSSADGLSVVTGLSTVGIQVHLRLRFLDPDGVARDFPPGLEVSVQGRTYSVAEEGKLTFAAPAASPPGVFTLDFPATAPRYVVCEPWSAGASPPTSGGTGSPPSYPALRDTAPDTTERSFLLPWGSGSPLETWTLVHSDWELTEATNVAYDATEGKLQHQNTTQAIGTATAPSVLTLDPKWLFFRFEFFDRRFGNAAAGSPPTSAHGTRVSLPPLPLEGFRNDRPAAGTNPDTRSNWVVGDDARKLFQCLPFIMRRDRAKNSLVGSLDGRHVGLRFAFPDDRFVYSQSAELRTIVAIAAGDARLNPGPERLKYYDLPRVWKSRQYYTRWTDPAAGGAFFHQPAVDTAKLGGANTRAKALTFSLDDIVLYAESGANIVPLTPWGANDRVTVFCHRFNATVGGAGVSKNGIYKLQTAGASMPDRFSIPQSNVNITRTPANDATAKDTYLNDYPDWTRLVVTQSGMFDVFSRRAPDLADANRVVGARAAVRYVDTTVPMTGVTTHTTATLPAPAAPANTPTALRWLREKPQRTDRPTANPDFVLQPFHWQRCAQFARHYDPAQNSRFGRFDMALLRCCDVTASGEEVATNLHYIRTHWQNDPETPAGRERARDIALNTANRWNGDDAINNCRALIVSDHSPPMPLRVQVVWFSQSATDVKGHYSLVGSAARSSRGANFGNGNYTTTETGTRGDGWFTTAHESGHENGLPDDYNERWSCASYDQLSYRHNGPPGDPYEPDGRDDANIYGTTSGGIFSASMMNVNCRLRARYFWPSAEWVSQIVGYACQVKFTDIETAPATEYLYKLPAHAGRADDKTYLSWPLSNDRNATANATPPVTSPPTPPTGTAWDKFQYDLYVLGKDHYSQHALGAQVNGARGARGLAALSPAPRFDGILIIGVRLYCSFPHDPTVATEDAVREDIAVRISATVRKGLCHRWRCSGTFQSQRFENCLIHFAPQLLVHNDPNSHYASPPKSWAPAALLTEYGKHFDLDVQVTAARASRWNIVARKLTVDYRAGQYGDVELVLQQQFPRFLGFDKSCASVTDADVTNIVNLLGGTGVAVSGIT